MPGADDPELPDRWYNGPNLPHWDGRFIPQSITFRLHDAVPENVLQKWKEELKSSREEQRKKLLRKRIRSYADQGYGQCWLKQSEIAAETEQTFLRYHKQQYYLHAWCVMPNHVHVLMTFNGRQQMGDVLHSWKSYLANFINQKVDRSGTVWMEDYFDRYTRNKEHFFNQVQYIERNPVAAGLCKNARDWKWSSAGHELDGNPGT